MGSAVFFGTLFDSDDKSSKFIGSASRRIDVTGTFELVSISRDDAVGDYIEEVIDFFVGVDVNSINSSGFIVFPGIA